jgi:hypothetical protein
MGQLLDVVKDNNDELVVQSSDLETWTRFMLIRWQTNAWWEGYTWAANMDVETWEAYEHLGHGFPPPMFADWLSEQSIYHVLSNWFLGGKSMKTKDLSEMQRAWFVYGMMESLRKQGRLT